VFYAGDDYSDINAMTTLRELVDSGRLSFAMRVAVKSKDSPKPVRAAANVCVNGVAGVARILAQLA
jgi:hypothetical protein